MCNTEHIVIVIILIVDKHVLQQLVFVFRDMSLCLLWLCVFINQLICPCVCCGCVCIHQSVNLLSLLHRLILVFSEQKIIYAFYSGTIRVLGYFHNICYTSFCGKTRPLVRAAKSCEWFGAETR
jgi:hypothetical protein